MHNARYKTLKNFFALELGADDKESMEYHASKMQSSYRWIFVGGILFSIICIPLILLPFLGIPLVVAGLMITNYGRKHRKELDEFKVLVIDDPDLVEVK